MAPRARADAIDAVDVDACIASRVDGGSRASRCGVERRRERRRDASRRFVANRNRRLIPNAHRTRRYDDYDHDYDYIKSVSYTHLTLPTTPYV